MRLNHSLVLLLAAVLLTACSATAPAWLRGGPNFATPGISNDG